MEETGNTLLGLICMAAMCLIPLAALAGGIVFFRRRKQARAVEASAPAAAAPAAAPVPAAPAAAAPASTMPAAAAGGFVHAASAPAPVSHASAGQGQPSQAPAAALSFTADLAPSEVVYLRGEYFAEEAGKINSEQMLGSGKRVKGPALAAAVLSAALVSLERTGAARLEPGRRKAMLGMKEKDTLFLVPNGGTSAFPANSYESKFLADARSMQVKNRNSLDNLVWSVLERDNSVPWMQVFEPLKVALAQRGLLGATKAMMGLMMKYDLPASTAAAIAQADVDGLRSMLDSAAAADPERWKIMQREIQEGIANRTASE